ncbi:hypothetical protein QYF36_009785 [Acer negundo]|nr:hypothetical protein QYF36_009785 [Acer negundo]
MFLLSRWFLWIDSPLSDSPKIRLRLRVLELEKTDDGDELMIMPQGKTGDLSIESIPFQDADCSISVTVDGVDKAVI